jgi:hypothetical protein
MLSCLNLAGIHHAQLQAHLFPGDQLEAVAVALCGRLELPGLTRLLVHEVVCIPHDECVRKHESVTWPVARYLEPLLEKARKRGLSILKIHSHPTGFDRFSTRDDIADADLFGSVHGWFDDQRPHVSAVMLPDGEVFGRLHLFGQTQPTPLDKVLLAGDKICLWEPNAPAVEVTTAGLRNAQAFGDGTYQILRRLKVGIVGCSGTGSPVIEQLARLSVGHLVLVDPDGVEEKNLNRILNATATDATVKRLKVDVLADAVLRMGLATQVTRFAVNLYDSPLALNELASCDVLIGCMDSVDGRELLNLLATYYVLPYLDLGVKLVADELNGVQSISGVVNYLQPGRSSLQTRMVYNGEDLRSASAYRQDPAGHADRVKNHYFKDVPVNRPAVLPVNMFVASAGILELLNRLHPYRSSPTEAAQLMIDMSNNCLVPTPEDELDTDEQLRRQVGRGTTTPFLGLVEFQS